MLHKLLLSFIICILSFLFVSCFQFSMRLTKLRIPRHFYMMDDVRSGDKDLADSLLTRFFSELPEPQRCPLCGGTVLPVYYGFGNAPEIEYDKSGRQRMAWLGCVDDETTWICLRCGHRYRIKQSYADDPEVID